MLLGEHLAHEIAGIGAHRSVDDATHFGQLCGIDVDHDLVGLASEAGAPLAAMRRRCAAARRRRRRRRRLLLLPRAPPPRRRAAAARAQASSTSRREAE